SRDVDLASGLLSSAIVLPIIGATRIVITVAALAVLHYKLALAALALTPGFLLISAVWARKVAPVCTSLAEHQERTDGRLVEVIHGFRVVRALGRARRELREFVAARHEATRKRLDIDVRESALEAGWGILAGILGVSILWVGGLLVLRHEATIGSILT